MGVRLHLADKKTLSNPPAFDPVLHGIDDDGGGSTPLGLSADRYEMMVSDSINYNLSGTGGSGGAYTIALDWDRVPVDPNDPSLKLLQLPGGVTYDGVAHLQGSPTQAGYWSIPVIVSRGGGSVQATFTLKVTGDGQPPSWGISTPPVLPDAMVGQAYSQQIEAQGGAAYTLQFALSGSSALPAGLAFSSSGLLSGTLGVAGTSSFQVIVTDHEGRSAARTFTLHTTATPFGFTTPAPGISINGPAGKQMRFQFSTTTYTGPRTFSLVSGCTLPEGCAISPSGVFTYTSAEVKAFEFDLEVVDANGRRATGHFMVYIHAVGDHPPGQAPPVGGPGGPGTGPEEPTESFTITSFHATGGASSGGDRVMVQAPDQYSKMPIFEDPDGDGPLDPVEIGYSWGIGWKEAPETGATGWANDGANSATFNGETFSENLTSVLTFMEGMMAGAGSSGPAQGGSSSWSVGETDANPVLITGGTYYFNPTETQDSTLPPDSTTTVSIGGAESCSIECSGLHGELTAQTAPGASVTYLFTWTEALITDTGPPEIHVGTATLTNATSGPSWTIEGGGPITNAATDPKDLLLKPPVIKGKAFSVSPLLPVEIDALEPDESISDPLDYPEIPDGEAAGVVLNFDDDDNDADSSLQPDSEDSQVDGENDLLPVKLHKLDISGQSVSFKLKYDSQYLKVWKQANKTEAVTSDSTEIDGTQDRVVWVEGIKVTPAFNSDETGNEITQRVKVGSGGWSDGDKLKVHVASPIFAGFGDCDQPYLLASTGPTPIPTYFGEVGDAPGDAELRSYLDAQVAAKKAKKKALSKDWVVDGIDKTTKKACKYSVTMSIKEGSSEKKLKMALMTQDADVCFNGHANFGIGPAFKKPLTTLDKFTNFSGRGECAINPGYMAGGQGHAGFTLAAGQVVAAPGNYNVPGLGMLRYPNNEGKGAGQAFVPFVSGGQTFHFTAPEFGNMPMVVVNSTSADVPQPLNYRSFFYDSCYSGRNFGESFAHGMFIYSVYGTGDDHSVKRFVEGVVGGKAWTAIKADLNTIPPLVNPAGFTPPYETKQF